MVKEWDTALIGDIFDFKNGLNKGKEFFGYGTPIVNYTDVYKKRALKRTDLKGRVSLGKDEIRRFEARRNDVFFTRTSETPDEVGMTSVLLDDIHDCVFSGFVLRARPKNDTLIPEYCQYCFSTKDIRSAIINGCTYTTRALTNGKQLSAIEIMVPEKSEQFRIAEALSNVDSMISSLEKLIAKKKAVKQGAMQELLSGKKRLPGFIEPWRKEAKIFTFAKGVQIDGSVLRNDLPYPVFNGGMSVSGYTSDYNCENTVIISEGGNSCGYVNYIHRRFWAGGHCYYITDSKVTIDFLYQLLKFREKDIMALRVGSGLPNIQKDSLDKMFFSYPKDEKEQETILEILMDMDSEIKTLEQKLTKTRHLKQGMMQQLLTGKIRLI